MGVTKRENPLFETILNASGRACLLLIFIYVKLTGKKLIFIAREYGQLGNRLFLFAHVMACAIENGFQVVNPSFREYRDIFEGSRNGLLPGYPPGRSRIKARGPFAGLAYGLIRRASLQVRDPDFGGQFAAIMLDNESRERFCFDDAEGRRLLKEKRVIFLCGWRFCDTSALIKHADKIRGYFTPLRHLLPAIEESARRAGEGCDVVVSVMIRHGDYRKWREGRYFYGTDRYVRIMEAAERLFPGRRVGFLITSNERQDPAGFTRFNTTICPPDAVHNLYALSKGDYLIGTLSTFARWAAFYGDIPLYTIMDPDAALSLDAFRPSRLDYPA